MRYQQLNKQQTIHKKYKNKNKKKRKENKILNIKWQNLSKLSVKT